MIQIEFDAEKIAEAMRRLEKVKWALQRAVYPAVYETLQNLAEQTTAFLRVKSRLPDRMVRRAISISGVGFSGDRIMGTILVRSAGIPLIYYDVEPDEITARPGLPPRSWPGFTYSLQDGERRSSLSMSTNRGGGLRFIKAGGLPFIARMPGGHLGVYYRLGRLAGQNELGERGSGQSKPGWGTGWRATKDHAAIQEEYGPTVQYHVMAPDVVGAIVERASADFPVILARHVERAVAQFGGES